MDYSALIKTYGGPMTDKEIGDQIERARLAAPGNYNPEVYKLCYSTIDLTSLTESDSVVSIRDFTRKAAEFGKKYPGIPNVATICVYPAFVDTVGIGVEGTDIGVTSVAGGFPAAQTFLEVKMLEIAMAVESGADEIDIVMNVGEMLSGEYDRVANDVEMMRSEAGEGIVFKVIIESGALKTPELIRRASLMAMLAGADFVKTSTGKIPVAATPEAAVIMCTAIKDYYERTGRKVGFKAAGGVRTAEEAAYYYTIVESILGKEWLTPSLFRIGASSLANNLLAAIMGKECKYF